ncbi:MAG: DUF6473 family protein [Aliishimia sp.]
MTLDSMGGSALDYLACRYGNSKLLFRGPRKDLGSPYVAFLGGTETYGKFVAEPFVDLLDQRLEQTCVNFGCVNAGVDVFLNDPFLPEAAHKARVTVLQVTGAQNLSNRLYAVHPRRNDRFVSATKMLKSIFPDVDFAGFHFNKHMLKHLQALSPDRYRIVEQELQDAWKARMEKLTQRIAGRILLTWVSERHPEDEDREDVEPMHVDRDMIEHMRPYVTEIAEITPSQAALTTGCEGMVYNELEAPAAREIMGPKAHEEIADELLPVLSGML